MLKKANCFGERFGEKSKHNDKAQWMKQVQNHTESVEAQEDFNITKARVQKHLKKVAKWKAPGPDLVHGY